MKELSADSWKRQGSAIIWDKAILQSLLPSASLVSLRQFLGWETVWPARMPRPCRTILIGGLQTCLESLPQADAEAFLLQRVQKVIHRHQAKLEQYGLIFGFWATQRAFESTQRDEEIYYKPASGPRVAVSFPLWGRGTSADIQLLLRSGQTREAIGYHVRRIS